MWKPLLTDGSTASCVTFNGVNTLSTSSAKNSVFVSLDIAKHGDKATTVLSFPISFAFLHSGLSLGIEVSLSRAFLSRFLKELVMVGNWVIEIFSPKKLPPFNKRQIGAFLKMFYRRLNLQDNASQDT